MAIKGGLRAILPNQQPREARERQPGQPIENGAKVAVMIGIERKGVLRMPAGRLYDAFLRICTISDCTRKSLLRIEDRRSMGDEVRRARARGDAVGPVKRGCAGEKPRRLEGSWLSSLEEGKCQYLLWSSPLR